jgi:anti-anti-sigma factor
MHFIDPEELEGLHDDRSRGTSYRIQELRTAPCRAPGTAMSPQVRRVVGESDELTRATMRTGGLTIVTLRDDLDFAAAPALREHLIDVLHRGIDLLILDLSHVPSCDAVGLAVLVATQRRAELLGITMRLVAPSLPVSKVLGSTGLMRHFAICPELSGALATQRPRRAELTSASAILPASRS